MSTGRRTGAGSDEDHARRPKHRSDCDRDSLKTARIDDVEADLDAKDARIADQRDRIDRLESSVNHKDRRIDHGEAENEALRGRCEELENRLADLEETVVEFAN